MTPEKLHELSTAVSSSWEQLGSAYAAEEAIINAKRLLTNAQAPVAVMNALFNLEKMVEKHREDSRNKALAASQELRENIL